MAHLPKAALPAHQPPSIRARITVCEDSIFGAGQVLIEDTTGRISLAPARVFLIRWLVALTIGGLLLAGARVESLQAMPRDNTTGPASREVTDETGRLVRIPQPVRRIVSLAPSVTETLFALGLGDRIVGDTDFCDYPPEAKQKRRIGGPVDPNIEVIAALHPDLVVATRSINRLASVHSLEQLGIPVYGTDPRSVEQVLTSTERLGQLLGAGDAGRSLLANLRARLSQIDRRLAGLPPQTVMVVVWLDPLISVGRNTFLEDALRRAGAHSIIDTQQSWPNINIEEVIRLQPKYLIFSSDDPQQVQRQLAELQDRPAWRQLDAVRNRRFIVVSEAISHPSPRLVDGIEQLAAALYPSRFASQAASAAHPAEPFPQFLVAPLSQPVLAFSAQGGTP
jgi:iron complex transport system substrate-binding protein